MAKIYTRTGDQGMTSILGGVRLPKSHPRFHAYGTIDELNVHLGILISQLPSNHADSVKSILLRIQNELFISGGLLACDDQSWLSKLPRLSENSIVQLENEIDLWNTDLPSLRNFILPGGASSALAAQLARTVCRRAERWTLDLIQDASPEFKVEYERVLKYLNRLSDHLFTLGRWLNHQAKVTETPWVPE